MMGWSANLCVWEKKPYMDLSSYEFICFFYSWCLGGHQEVTNLNIDSFILTCYQQKQDQNHFIYLDKR